MKLSYFLLGDAMTRGVDGKLNILGADVSTLMVGALPALVPAAVAIRLEVGEEELGAYPFALTLGGPTGKQKLGEGTIEAGRPANYVAELPIGMAIQANILLPLASNGRHELVFSLGRKKWRYPFMVRADANSKP